MNATFQRAMAALVVVAAGIFAVPSLQGQTTTKGPAEVYGQLISMAEHQLVQTAEAMPADKYNFAPTHGEFKGVRTFAEQLQHVIKTNYLFFASAGSLHPASVPNVADLTTKAQIVQALKDSFALGHHAAEKLTTQNAFEEIKPVDGVDTRAGVLSFALWHMNDHYGQLVEYLRMNDIIPPSSRHHGK